ncbi:hypothetical protein R1sor_021407 [Riccia sorocarpa]|uniref:Uncharacterized protein n=1 Tax=Riccia sorocarpa TaxID=122646 RepID=A0ABD3GIM1_9MARC
MAEGGESVTSCDEEQSPQKNTSEDLETSGLRSLRSTTSLVFNLENYLLEGSPQPNVGSVLEALRRKGADTPQSRSSSVVKRDIGRREPDSGIGRGLFRSEDENGGHGEGGERLRVQHSLGEESILEPNVAKEGTLCVGQTVVRDTGEVQNKEVDPSATRSSLCYEATNSRETDPDEKQH